MGYNTPFVIFGDKWEEVEKLENLGRMIFMEEVPKDIGWSGLSEHADMYSLLAVYKNNVLPLSLWFCPFGITIDVLSVKASPITTNRTVVFNALNDGFIEIKKCKNLGKLLNAACSSGKDYVGVGYFCNPINVVAAIEYDSIGFFAVGGNSGFCLGEVDWVEKQDRDAWFQAMMDTEPTKRINTEKGAATYNVKKFIPWVIKNTEDLIRFRKFDRNMQKRREKCS